MHFARNILAAIIGASLAAAASENVMPLEQQNALVKKYCAVCHTDAVKNGGLTLEHFDAAQASPSLTAMMLSKLTGGVLLKTVREAPSNPDAAAFMRKRMGSGAMGAAGIPIPDKATIDGLIQAFAVESAGATEWTVERSKDNATLTASIVQEMPSSKNAGEAEAYRLIAACNPATQEGYVQLAWSPAAQNGPVAASVDGGAAVQYRVEGSEAMGNNSGLVLNALASLALAESKRGGAARGGFSFPVESLTIRDLFPGERVTFPFAHMPKDARREIEACFPGAGSSTSLAADERSGNGR